MCVFVAPSGGTVIALSFGLPKAGRLFGKTFAGTNVPQFHLLVDRLLPLPVGPFHSNKARNGALRQVCWSRKPIPGLGRKQSQLLGRELFFLSQLSCNRN